MCFRPVDVKGPIGIGHGDFEHSTIALSSQIMARYCNGLPGERVKRVIETPPPATAYFIVADRMNDEQLEAFRI